MPLAWGCRPWLDHCETSPKTSRRCGESSGGSATATQTYVHTCTRKTCDVCYVCQTFFWRRHDGMAGGVDDVGDMAGKFGGVHVCMYVLPGTLCAFVSQYMHYTSYDMCSRKATAWHEVQGKLIVLQYPHFEAYSRRLRQFEVGGNFLPLCLSCTTRRLQYQTQGQLSSLVLVILYSKKTNSA